MAVLTTIAKVRTQVFGNEPAIEADTILTTLMTSSTAWVEQQVGGDLVTATITETLDGDGRTSMRLRRAHAWRPGNPPTTITSVTVDGTLVPARAAVTSVNTNPSGYIYRNGVVDLVGYSFTEGTANVVIVHVSGFATCPTDVEQALLEHIALRFKDRGHSSVDSTSNGDGSANYSAVGTLAYIESVLAPYRPMGFA